MLYESTLKLKVQKIIFWKFALVFMFIFKLNLQDAFGQELQMNEKVSENPKEKIKFLNENNSAYVPIQHDFNLLKHNSSFPNIPFLKAKIRPSFYKKIRAASCWGQRMVEVLDITTLEDVYSNEYINIDSAKEQIQLNNGFFLKNKVRAKMNIPFLNDTSNLNLQDKKVICPDEVARRSCCFDMDYKSLKKYPQFTMLKVIDKTTKNSIINCEIEIFENDTSVFKSKNCNKYLDLYIKNASRYKIIIEASGYKSYFFVTDSSFFENQKFSPDFYLERINLKYPFSKF